VLIDKMLHARGDGGEFIGVKFRRGREQRTRGRRHKEKQRWLAEESKSGMCEHGSGRSATVKNRENGEKRSVNGA
jgi:hypothetical protein